MALLHPILVANNVRERYVEATFYFIPLRTEIRRFRRCTIVFQNTCPLLCQRIMRKLEFRTCLTSVEVFGGSFREFQSLRGKS